MEPKLKNEQQNDKEANTDSSFILKRNKQSGNFSILRKGSSDKSVQKVKYTAYNIYLPFGREEYNDNLIINGIITDATNINHNLMITLNKIIRTFTELKYTDAGKYKYLINELTFFPFLKIVDPLTEKGEGDTDLGTTNDIQPVDKQKVLMNPIFDEGIILRQKEKIIKKYQLRMYLKYGAKITHAKLVGELSADQLKGKRCNLEIELGSMWVNNDIMQYGINIYITHITVLN